VDAQIARQDCPKVLIRDARRRARNAERTRLLRALDTTTPELHTELGRRSEHTFGVGDEAAAEKEQADGALKTAMELAPPTLSVDEVLAVVERCGGLAGVLQEATDAERAALYASIGVSAVYNPERNEVRLGVDPVALTVCRRGDLRLDPTAPAYTAPFADRLKQDQQRPSPRSSSSCQRGGMFWLRWKTLSGS
jgi:hypothetical protein